MTDMTVEERQLRADAARNRTRLLEAAARLFRERGLDVSVAEIAEAAGVGRGTLFRNFASKEDLIAAIVAEKMAEASTRGRELLDQSATGGEALFEFLGEMVGRQQVDRALFEALDDTWLGREEIRQGQAEVIEVIDQLLRRAQKEGSVRPDIGAMDVMMLFKGACAAAMSLSFGHDPTLIDRHLDLLWGSISAGGPAPPLRGRTPQLEDISPARG
jgi:AcrR family transcriptional regulator